jgi:hypothetical protein
VELHIQAAQSFATLCASVIGAFAGVISLWLKYAEKHDKVKVGYGPVSPEISPEVFLYVCNLCDHPVLITDYGFVMQTGELLSLPLLTSEGNPDEYSIIGRGDRLLKERNDCFERGIELHNRPIIGAYAILTTRRNPLLAFRDETPLRTRFWTSFKIRRGIRYIYS